MNLQRLRSFIDSPALTHTVYPLIVLCDAVVSICILRFVKFTNIDFVAYMEEVEPVVLRFETNYSKLNGGTGPIAYPAGFVYFYSFISLITNGGEEIFTAQMIFFGLHLLTTIVVAKIYVLGKAPCWTLVLALMSKRVHSIFLLRMFNDAISACFAYISILLLLNEHSTIASCFLSLAVSVKIGPCFYWAPFGLRLILDGGWANAIPKLSLIVLIQLVLGLPFLLTDHKAYIGRSFGGPGDLQQVWSVNWKFLPSELFHHVNFQLLLFATYVITMMCFLYKKWCPQGIFSTNAVWKWKRSR